MRHVTTPGGQKLTVLGLGTWKLGEDHGRKAAETTVVRRAIELGYTLIDTAEIYANGASETIVGEAIKGKRDALFLVTKVAPSNATRRGTIKACEASLKRLGTEVVDLYLLHWMGGTPVAETVDAFETLKADGKIRAWGVSNFDVDDMATLPDGCAANQVLYNPQSRGIEFDLVPFCQQHGIPIMAYTPLGRSGKMLKDPAIMAIAARHDATPAQVALAWAIRLPGVLTIPKTANLARLEENLAAAALTLTSADLAEIDRAFPGPAKKRALDII
jgi:diketogulonate reductase-like aldo/keto reductase